MSASCLSDSWSPSSRWSASELGAGHVLELPPAVEREPSVGQLTVDEPPADERVGGESRTGLPPLASASCLSDSWSPTSRRLVSELVAGRLLDCRPLVGASRLSDS